MFGRYRTANQSASSSFSNPFLKLSAIHCSTSGDDTRQICGSLFNLRLERVHSSSCSAIKCPTIKNHKYVNQQMIPFPNNQRLITYQATTVSRECNWIITRVQDFFKIKIENIYVSKLKKQHGNAFKNWFCPNFLLLPKKSEKKIPPDRAPMKVREEVV